MRHVGVQIGGEPRDPLQIFGVAVAEMGGQHAAAHLAELEPAGDDAAFAERDRRFLLRGPFFGLRRRAKARPRTATGRGGNRVRAPRARTASPNRASSCVPRNRYRPSAGTSRPKYSCRRRGNAAATPASVRYGAPTLEPSYSAWVLASNVMPPLSSSTMRNGVLASASAIEMPTGPPPTIARSGCRTVPSGTVRASMNALKALPFPEITRNNRRPILSAPARPCLVGIDAAAQAGICRTPDLPFCAIAALLGHNSGRATPSLRRNPKAHHTDQGNPAGRHLIFRAKLFRQTEPDQPPPSFGIPTVLTEL